VAAVSGSGTADEPFGLPYLETFGPAVDEQWLGLEPVEGAMGEWTWEVSSGQLVATGGNATVTAARVPWFPWFDLPESDAIEVRIVVARSAGEAACGLALGTGNDRIIGFMVDPADRRYWIWAPVTIGDEPAWTPETSVRSGTNVVTVVINAPQSSDVLSLFVNGEKVIDVTGFYEPLGPVTRVAPLGVLGAGDTGECWFDDFAVTRQVGGS
jgi:hypothetical protein